MKLPALLVRLLCGSIFLGALSATAQTTVFNDTFSGASTVNADPASPAQPTATATSYQILANKAYNPAPPTIATGHLKYGIAGTTSGSIQAQALFTRYPITLSNTGEYLELTVVYTNFAGPIVDFANSGLYLGLFNGGQVQPFPGGLAGTLASGSTNAATGYAKNWEGYIARILFGASSSIVSRLAQTTANNLSQDTTNLYTTPAAAQIGSSLAAPSSFTAPTVGNQYTAVYRITKASATNLTFAFSLYEGASTSGSLLISHSTSAAASIATYDALSIGYREVAASGATSATTIDLNSVKIVTTAAATIAPVITTQPVGQSVTAGANVTLTVAAEYGAATPTYQWKKNGVDISGATTSSYTISNAAAGDSGDYTVVLTNVAGSVTSSTATISVTSGLVAPAVATNPTGATILTGGSHTFNVIATGSTPLSYQWEKSTDGVSYAPISGATNSSHAVSSAVLADAGQYRVVITNAAGSATSTAATLLVNQVPAITSQPTGGSIALGGSLTLSVSATGTPAPTYQWRLNGSAISGATSSSYAITSATGAATGNYTVVVTNSAGSVTSSGASVAVLSSTMTATAFTPANAATTLNPDTRLTITFNEAVTPGRLRLHPHLRCFERHRRRHHRSRHRHHAPRHPPRLQHALHAAPPRPKQIDRRHDQL